MTFPLLLPSELSKVRSISLKRRSLPPIHTEHIPGLVFLIIWARLWRTTLEEKVEERLKGMEQIVDLISTGYQIDSKHSGIVTMKGQGATVHGRRPLLFWYHQTVIHGNRWEWCELYMFSGGTYMLSQVNPIRYFNRPLVCLREKHSCCAKGGFTPPYTGSIVQKSPCFCFL